VRVLLVLPPVNLDGERCVFRHQPIVTAYLAGAAERAGAEVRIVDAAFEGISPAALGILAADFNPDVVGLVPYEYKRELPLSHSDAAAREIRARCPGVLIGLLNGIEDEQRVALKQRVTDGVVDFAILGDSEVAFESIAQHGLGEVVPPGVTLRTAYGAIVEGGSLPDTPLDDLAFPAWHLIDFTRYRRSPHRYRTLPVLPILASRACPYACDFYPQALFMTRQKHRVRSPESILAEVMYLVETFGVREIEFYDPTFAARRKDTMALCEALFVAGKPVTWSCNSRCDLLTDELIQAMVRAGCRRVLLGIESGDQALLDPADKSMTLEDIRRASKALDKHGVETIAGSMVGLPGETPTSVEGAIRFALELAPSYVAPFLARGAPYTTSSRRWLDAGRFESSWEVNEAGSSGPLYSPEAFANLDEMRALVRSAYRRFYGRPTYAVRQLGQLRSSERITRLWRGVGEALRAAWMYSSSEPVAN
jgi:anaerobic magnesium-protoporphyrin IX monomethyl ester cyclase